METKLTGWRVDEFGDVFKTEAWRVSNREYVNFDAEDIEQMRGVSVFHTMTIGVNFFTDKASAAHASIKLLMKEEDRLVEQGKLVHYKIENIIREFPEVMKNA